jgi:hypothetical protein
MTLIVMDKPHRTAASVARSLKPAGRLPRRVSGMGIHPGSPGLPRFAV